MYINYINIIKKKWNACFANENLKSGTAICKTDIKETRTVLANGAKGTWTNKANLTVSTWNFVKYSTVVPSAGQRSYPCRPHLQPQLCSSSRVYPRWKNPREYFFQRHPFLLCWVVPHPLNTLTHFLTDLDLEKGGNDWEGRGSSWTFCFLPFIALIRGVNLTLIQSYRHWLQSVYGR